MRRHVIIFDLYGTLADVDVDESSNSTWIPIVDSISALSGGHATPTPDEFAARFRRECEELAALGTQSSITDKAFMRLSRSYGVDFVPGVVDLWSRSLRRESLRQLSLRPYTLNLIGDLRAVPGNVICLLSNTEATLTRFDLELLGISSLFDVVALSSDTGMWKPEEMAGQDVLRRVSATNGQAVIVGDTPATDGELARVLGCPFILVNSVDLELPATMPRETLVAEPNRRSIEDQLQAAGVEVRVLQP